MPTKKETLTALHAAKEHWLRLKWASEVLDEAEVIAVPFRVKVLKKLIGESFYGYDCALCELFLEGIDKDDGCNSCPIGIAGLTCGVFLSPWNKVIIATTWKETAVRSQEMVDMLCCLIAEWEEKK